MQMLVPTPSDLRATLDHGARFWQRGGYACDDDALPPAAVIERTLELIATNPASKHWYAPRLFLDITSRVILGSGGYKTARDSPTGVEIGYGIAARHRCQGHATRAVQTLVAALLADPVVSSVCATVRPSNLPSIRVLNKCGFQRCGKVEDPNDGWLDRYEIHR